MPAPTNGKQIQSFTGMINYLSKFFCQIVVRYCRAHPGVGKEQSTFQLGPRTSNCFCTDEIRNHKHSYLGLLQSSEENCLVNWCKICMCMSSTRRKTSIFCEQSTYRSTVGLHSYWIGIICSCLADEVSSFPICKPLHIGSWSEAARSYFI